MKTKSTILVLFFFCVFAQVALGQIDNRNNVVGNWSGDCPQFYYVKAQSKTVGYLTISKGAGADEIILDFKFKTPVGEQRAKMKAYMKADSYRIIFNVPEQNMEGSNITIKEGQGIVDTDGTLGIMFEGGNSKQRVTIRLKDIFSRVN